MRSLLLVFLMGFSVLSSAKVNSANNSITISSVKELADVAKKSNQIVKMIPGTYKMQDFLTKGIVAGIKPDAIARCAMIEFSGSNNTFDLSNVTIEVNTELLSVFKKYVIEFYITGSNNSINGLKIVDIGNSPTFRGGNTMTILGDNNLIKNVTMNVSGSSPYGYGDLIGKGKGTMVALKKHSGMLIEGVNDSIIGCNVVSKSFGHCFFIQGGVNTYFENCTAEAQVRSTADMLAETSGPAFDVNFESVYKNRLGERKIPTGYVKSLSECGFRTYGSGGPSGRSTGAVTAINCIAQNTRIGFAFAKVGGDILIKSCEAYGCEAAYNVNGVTIENSKGDAKYGPLLYVESGAPSTIELTLLPDTSTAFVHAIACVEGDNHVITLTSSAKNIRPIKTPILIGTARPSGSNSFSPYNDAEAKGVVLNNSTGMPVELSPKASGCIITSNGVVQDKGMANKISLNGQK